MWELVLGQVLVCIDIALEMFLVSFPGTSWLYIVAANDQRQFLVEPVGYLNQIGLLERSQLECRAVEQVPLGEQSGVDPNAVSSSQEILQPLQVDLSIGIGLVKQLPEA